MNLKTIEPLSRLKARDIAGFIRKFLGLSGTYADVSKMLDKLADEIPSFNYEIVEDNDLPDMVYGAFVPNYTTNEAVIKIPNRVYLGACSKGTTSGRDRMTIVHEISHYFLIVIFDFKPIETLSRGRVPKSNDPEWQAMAVAGEILMPYTETMHIQDPYELALICGVSLEAANYRINKYGKAN